MYEAGSWHVGESLLSDFRHAFRVLRKSPGFTLVAVLTLSLGIGANAVVLGVLNAVLLQELDVSEPQNLYQVRHQTWMSGRLLTTPYAAFNDFRRRNTTFSAMTAIYGYSGGTLSWRNSLANIHGDEVTGNYFDMLGVQPQAGRFFHENDEHGPNSAPYLVLSDALWRSHFGGHRSIIGTTVDFNKHPFTVIGVAPREFHGAERFVWPDYWMPMVNEEQVEGDDYLHGRTGTPLTVIGRLKRGVTVQQASENLNAISAELGRVYPKSDDGLPVRLVHPGLFGDEGDLIRGFLYSVTVLALLVLGAACANLSSLFAARAADRNRELALRAALGASRWRLARQLLAEAVLLALGGGVAGLVTAHVLLGILNRWQPAADAHLAAGFDARVYAAGLLLTLGSALLFGLVPARQAWGSDPLQAMKSGPADATLLSRFALRDLMLGLQIAICTLLVTASLVAARGMVRTLQAPLGIRPQGAMLAEVDAPEKQREMTEAMLSIPGVTAAGTANRMPMTGGIRGIPVYRPGTTEFTLKNYALATYVFAMSPGYLDAAGTVLLGGRDVSWHDSASMPYVAVVNETFARKMWAEPRPIGRRFILRGHLTEVVGVVETGKYHDVTEAPQSAVFVPYAQSDPGGVVLVVRSRREPGEMVPALKRTLSSLQPNAPIAIRSWSDALADQFFPARAATVALGVMGLLASALAVTGIAGMAAYSVSRRMKELGIRVALGARKSQVASAAVGRPMVLLGVGSALGLVPGMFASRLLAHIVYQADPRDPAVVCGVVLTMAVLGVAASAIPVRRALAVNASLLMREE